MKELEKAMTVVPMDPEEQLKMLEKLRPKPTKVEYDFIPKNIRLGSHHDPRDIKRSLRLLREWGRIKEEDEIEIEKGDKQPDIVVGHDKYEIETGLGPTRYGRTLYDIRHIISQSMKMLMKNPKDNLYYLFVDGRPHNNLELFLKHLH